MEKAITTEPELIVFDDSAALIRAAARRWATELQAAARKRGAFHAALSGGRTPKALFFILAGEDYRALPWSECDLYWGDERYVPPDHLESNYRTARELLLSRVPVAEQRVHPMPTDAGDPAADAAKYESLLREQAPLEDGLPRLDLVLMGLGPDGHTASLFPDSTAAREKTRWAIEAYAKNKPPRSRITLTAPVFNRARNVLFLISGESKAEMVRELLSGSESPEKVPAKLIRPTAGRLTYMVDKEAASQL